MKNLLNKSATAELRWGAQMSKMAVVFSSKTGNTEKVAAAIQAGLPSDTPLLNVKDQPQLADYDLIFYGYWVDKGGPDPLSLEFMKSITNPKVALFATLGAEPDSQHAADSLEAGAQGLTQSTVVARFICQGAIDPKLISWMEKLDADHPHYPDEKRRQRWAEAAMHPNTEDLAAATAFAQTTYQALEVNGD